jgi:alpha-tubulin suppressor-like RCC1 family protein
MNFNTFLASAFIGLSRLILQFFREIRSIIPALRTIACCLVISNITAYAQGIAMVSAGGDHSLFLESNGSVWAAGSNDKGQLGDGGTSPYRATPAQVMSGVIAVSAGTGYSLFLKADGSVWATGSNTTGQLGDGTSIQRNTPVKVMSSAVALAAGSNHSLFLKSDGSVWATGYNYDGQLGTGSFRSSDLPVQIMTGVTAISAGGSHSLFLKVDGSVWAAGANNYGQFGASSSVSYYERLTGYVNGNPRYTQYPGSLTPIQVMTFVTAISAGVDHSLFLRTDGTAWAAGHNNYGQLGAGSLVDTSAVRVMSGVSAISAGWNHSLFLKTGGSVWSTGLNNYGQLGNGTPGNRSTPVQVMIDVTAIAASGREYLAHSLFFKTDGSAWATGSNDYGQLGDGSYTNRSTVNLTVSQPPQITVQPASASTTLGSTQVLSVGAQLASAYQWYQGASGVISNPISGATEALFTTPALTAPTSYWVRISNRYGSVDSIPATVHILPGSSQPAVSAGSDHSLFLKSDGTVWAAGTNDKGQLGDGGTSPYRATPAQVMTGAIAVSAGTQYSLFLKANGTVWAAGFNLYGTLGDGTRTQRNTPVQVMSGVAAMAAGYSHSLFLKRDGTVWAVGSNTFGEFGIDTNVESTPVQVMTGVIAVSAGSGYSLFLKADGSAWAAGLNNYGQLGLASNGDYTRHPIPQRVMTFVAAISAGPHHSLFLRADGTAWAAGHNNYGQLGAGSLGDRPATRVMGGVSAISAGWNHSLFLKPSGSVWSTGLNNYGQLGNGRTGNVSTPSQVMIDVTAIAACGGTNVGGAAGIGGHSLFLKADGSAWGTGSNYYGQLGDGSYKDTSTAVNILTLVPPPQKITFASLTDRTPTSAPFGLTASASSLLPVSFDIVSGPATLTGNTVALTGAAGIVTIRASQAGNASYAAAPSIDGSFTVATSAALLANWAASTGLSGANALPTASPFNDGVQNLLKFAFNMNATSPDVSVLATGGTAGLPQVVLDKTGTQPVLRVVFLRRKVSGLIYTPQRSTTLGSFVAMSGTPTVTTIDAQWERVTIEEPAPPATAPSAFARVQVSLP